MSDGLGSSMVVTVSDPRGPRAAVPHPPFPSAVPILFAKGVDLPADAGSTEAVWLHVDCSGHPAAARLVACRKNDALRVAVQMRTHRTGNGYLVLRIEADPDAGPAGEARLVEIALDPVIHAPVIDALASVGRAYLTDAGRGSAAGGWLVGVNQEAVRDKTAAALAHPRSVRFRVVGPGR